MLAVGIVGSLPAASLALGVDRVKGQRGFSRARQTRKNHQFVPRNLERNVAKIVGACTLHANCRSHGARLLFACNTRIGRREGAVKGLGLQFVQHVAQRGGLFEAQFTGGDQHLGLNSFHFTSDVVN